MKRLLSVLLILLAGLSACSQPAESPTSAFTPTPQITMEFKTPLPQATEAQAKATNTPVPPPPTPTPRPTATTVAVEITTAVTETEKTAVPPSTTTDIMVKIPAGKFMMGNANGAPEEGPVHEVDLPAYEIDVFEVTNADFAAFVKSTGYATNAETTGKKNWNNEFTEGKDNLPVIRVTWNDAAAYCEWAGKRLPTEAEWEKAARGPEGFLYPWGNAWDAAKANVKESGLRAPAAVGSFGAGASPYGVEDMAGNVWEWTADWYQAYPGNTTADSSFGEQCRVTRGGGWFDEALQATATNRNCANPDTTAINELGFRCARSE